MIKLITQFDNEKSKLSLATPTCGCCSCCCCCCIVSTVASASITARSFGNYVEKELPDEPEKIKYARKIGFWFPIGFILVLGLALWFCIGVIPSYYIIGLIGGGIAYLSFYIKLLKKINIPKISFIVIEFSVLLGIIEVIGFFISLGLLEVIGNIGWYSYLVVAVTISILLILWAFQKDYDNLEDKKNEKEITNSSIITNESDNKKSNLKVPKGKKKCPNCGTENAIDNKRCIYCSNVLEADDKK